MKEIQSIFRAWLKSLRGFVNQVMVVVKDTCQLTTKIGWSSRTHFSSLKGREIGEGRPEDEARVWCLLKKVLIN